MKVALLVFAAASLVALAAVPAYVAGEADGGQRSGLAFYAGSDSSPSCPSYPCATVIPGQGDSLISLSLGKESVEAPQPETYYTDLLRLTNPTGSDLTVVSVALSGVSEARPGDIGSITIFYCMVQTNAPEGSCAGSFTSQGQTGGVLFSGNDILAPGATRYIELAGFAGPSAQAGDAISFTIEVTAG